jgi:hypothetical protein
MATTKKTEKKDDVKKTTAKKPAAKKKTTVKKEVESTGVVDEFLSNAIGETITKEEAEKQPEPKKKKTTTKKKTETVEKKKKTTTKKNDVKQNDEIVTYPGLTTEKYLVDEEFTEKWEKLGLGEDVQEEIKEIVDNVHNQQESDMPNNPDDAGSEKYANEVNTLVKKWDDTDIMVNNNEKGEIAKVPVEKQNGFYKPRHDVYPPITNENEKTEEKKPEEKKETSTPVTVESLRVKFEDQKTENNFTFVTTSMGVRYD